MSFVIVGGERFALEYGETVLGGRGPAALLADPLGELPAAVVITYPLEGSTTARSLGIVPALLNGEPLLPGAHPLQHGDRLRIQGVQIAYGDARVAGRTSNTPGVEQRDALAAIGSGTPTAAAGGHIRRLATGIDIAIRDEGLTIGRDPECDVPLRAKDVSRLHAVITPGLLGYMLTDRSSNGVTVNGSRVDGSCWLGQGDVIVIGGEQFRFTADPASFEMDAQAPGIAPPDPVPPAQHLAPALLASLEVTSDGPLGGERFRIERPVVQLGRGQQNDIQLRNESVSGTHASLLLRGDRWVIVDLGSRNGTYVDGVVVREQAALPRVCELRLGNLALLFRSIGTPQHGDRSGTIGVIGLRVEQGPGG